MPALMNLTMPNVKFIVVMRNPANRLYSNFTFTCACKYSRNIRKWPHKLRKGSAKIFHNVIEQRIELFNNCTKTETASVFECANLIFTRARKRAGESASEASHSLCLEIGVT